MRVAVVVLDGVFDTGLASIVDTFATANALAARSRFIVTRVGVRPRVKTAHGLAVPLEPLPTKAPDLAIVPALGAKDAAGLDAALDRRDVDDVRVLLRKWAAAGTRLAGACTATFVLASADLLNEQNATTTWWLASMFRDRFPRVNLDASRMIVDARGAVTAGAALGHLDLALWIVRQKSPSLARVTAKHLAFAHSPSQSAYTLPDHIAHADPLVERFESWAMKNLCDFSLGAAARAIGGSQRTVERRVQRALGRSPLAFVQDLRVEDALHQLETTDRSVDEVASRVGYHNATTLRTLLRRKTGLGIRQIRAR